MRTQLDFASEATSILDGSEVIHNSRPPLRWFANWAGNRASSAIMRISFAEEDGNDSGWKYKRDSLIWHYLWPISEKYGTFYKLNRKFYNEWDFEDEETGDAMRIIYNED